MVSSFVLSGSEPSTYWCNTVRLLRIPAALPADHFESPTRVN